MADQVQTFLKIVRHPLKFRWFLLSKLPSAFFAGVRIRQADTRHCVVTVPYKWFSQNPFRSTYFACLSMAAEMSTGVLAMTNVYKRKPGIAMLVVKVESEYFKKAAGRSTFVCEDGEIIQAAVEETIRTAKPVTVRARSVGRNEEGEMVAEFFITWSFKARQLVEVA